MINDIVIADDGTRIHNPYNSINREITETDVRTILMRYGIPEVHATVQNMELYKRAFVHPSYTKRPAYENEQLGIVLADAPPDCLPLKTKSFQNLEFLGDGVLELIAKYYIYRRFPKSQEGFKTELKIALVKNESIGKIAAEMGLNKWILISKHAEENNVRYDVRKQLGNLFEAFIGAMFLDFNKIKLSCLELNGEIIPSFEGAGFQMANLFLCNVFEKHVDWNTLITANNNYKKQLQECLQKKFGCTPIYITLDRNVDTNLYRMGVFLCIGINVNPKCETIDEIMKKVTIDMTTSMANYTLETLYHHMENENGGKIFALLGVGEQNIKKDAEQRACESALRELKLV